MIRGVVIRAFAAGGFGFGLPGSAGTAGKAPQKVVLQPELPAPCVMTKPGPTQLYWPGCATPVATTLLKITPPPIN